MLARSHIPDSHFKPSTPSPTTTPCPGKQGHGPHRGNSTLRKDQTNRGGEAKEKRREGSQLPQGTEKYPCWLLINNVHHQKLIMYYKCGFLKLLTMTDCGFLWIFKMTDNDRFCSSLSYISLHGKRLDLFHYFSNQLHFFPEILTFIISLHCHILISRFYKDLQIRKPRHWESASLVKGHTNVGQRGMEAIPKSRLHSHLCFVGSAYPETSSSPFAAGGPAGGSPESSGPAQGIQPLVSGTFWFHT